jgi:hypothetical protein
MRRPSPPRGCRATGKKIYGGNGGKTTKLWLLLVKERAMSTGWEAGFDPGPFLIYRRREIFLDPKYIPNRRTNSVFWG